MSDLPEIERLIRETLLERLRERVKEKLLNKPYSPEAMLIAGIVLNRRGKIPETGRPKLLRRIGDEFDNWRRGIKLATGSAPYEDEAVVWLSRFILKLEQESAGADVESPPVMIRRRGL